MEKNTGYGETIRMARKRIPLTQQELGMKIGVSRSAIYDWEREKYPPTDGKNINALEQALGFESGELFQVIFGEGAVKSRKDTWEVLVVLEDRDDWGRELMMDMRNDGGNRFSIHVGPTKVGVEIVGRIESEAQLDDLLAEAREKALAAMELQRQQKR